MKEISKITPEEYKEFYKSFDSDFGEPLDWIHFKVEGEIEFTALIYIPKVLPYMAMMKQFNPKGKNKNNAAIKLFVRRVLISDNFDGLLPKYFSFIKGIVDSDDLPLNVSRETLQNEKAIKVIKKQVVKKIIDRLTKYSKQDIDDEYLEEEENMSDEQLAELDKKIEKRKKEM
jgi:heat shock protein beta